MAIKIPEWGKDIAEAAGDAAVDEIIGQIRPTWSPQTATPTPAPVVVQQSSTPTWLPWALGGLGLLAFGGLVLAATGGPRRGR